MAVPAETSSMPEKPSTADVDAIASRTFSSSFRGWDPDEVRVHLVHVAELVRGLMHRQAELERRLVEAEAAARRADITELDVEEVSKVLGEETARVLRIARESAAEIRSKAEERVALLSRQAADDAAKSRDTAVLESERLRTTAHEEAAATRSAGEAYVADLRAEAESEIAEHRVAVDEDLAALRQSARDDAAQVGAAADDAAAMIRNEAENEAAEKLGEATRSATELRDEAERDVVELRATVAAEVAESRVLSAEQVAEAERVRERVLADFARKRKAARLHLEQLRAGRDRLLEAYEVIRATTDNATRELGVVLPDAKRAANEAARRVTAEPDQSVGDLEAELAIAREANLPILAPARSAADAGVDADSDGFEESDVSDDPDVTDASDGLDDVEATVLAAESAESAESADAASKDRGDLSPRKPNRRFRLRHDDPLGGESLPEAALAPVVAGADFEGVRVIESSAEAALQAVGKQQSPDVDSETGAVEPEAEATEIIASEVDTSRVDTSEMGATESVESTSEAPAGNASGHDQPEATEAQTPTKGASDPKGSEPEAVGPNTVATETVDADSGDTTKSSVAVGVASDGPTTPETAAAEPDIDGLFERLRSERGTDVAGPTTDPTGDAEARPDSNSGNAADPDSPEARIAALFERRDLAVDEVGRRLSKRLKRALSDEQSELLDVLRRNKKRPAIEDLLGLPEVHEAAFAELAGADLPGAAIAGVHLAGDLDDNSSESTHTDLDEVSLELARSIVGPIRSHLERALSDEDPSDDDPDVSADSLDELELADRIRSCYREWRGIRLTDVVADACATAFGLGLRDALPDEVALTWTVDQSDQPCADCDDNALAGAVAKGEPFPTGQTVAPAHPGCHCLALPPLS